MKGEKYTEHLDAFSFDQTAVGKDFTFSLKQEGNTLTQIGKIDTEQYKDFTVKDYYRKLE